jgi:L-rhamnose mutarotase
MKRYLQRWGGAAVILCVGWLIGFACSEAAKRGSGQAQAAKPETASPNPEKGKVQRFGMVIGLRPEKREYYNKLHANPWPEVNQTIKKSNLRSYSIYETQIEGKWYLFSYFEYVGDDFKADMAKIGANKKTREWWKETDPCQIRLPGAPKGEQWLKIPEVYHLD